MARHHVDLGLFRLDADADVDRDDDDNHAVPETDVDANNEHGAPVVPPLPLRLRHWLHRATRRVPGRMLIELLRRHGRNPVACLRRLLARLGRIRAPDIAWERYRWRRETTQLALEILAKIGAVAGGIGLAAVLAPRLSAWWSYRGDVVPYKEMDLYNQSIALAVIYSTLPAAVMWGDLGPLREANATFNLNIHLPENSLPSEDADSLTGAPRWVANSANRPVPERYFLKDLFTVSTSLCHGLQRIADHGPPTFRFTNGSSTQFRWSTDPEARTFLPPHATLPPISADGLSEYFRQPSGSQEPDDGLPEPTARPRLPAYVENLDPPLDRLCLRLDDLDERLTKVYRELIDNGVYGTVPKSARASLQGLEQGVRTVRELLSKDSPEWRGPRPFGGTDRSRILCLRNQTASLYGQGSSPEGASCDQPPQSRSRRYLSWSQDHNDTAFELIFRLDLSTIPSVNPAMENFVEAARGGIFPRYIEMLEEMTDALGSLIEYAEQVGPDLGIDSSRFAVPPELPACKINCVSRFCRLVVPFLAEVAIPRLHDMAHRASVGNRIIQEASRREDTLILATPLYTGRIVRYDDGWMDLHLWIDKHSPERGLMVFPHVRELLKDLKEGRDWIEMMGMLHEWWRDDEIKRFVHEVTKPGVAAHLPEPMLFSRLGLQDARPDPYGADAVMPHTDQRCVEACEGKLADESVSQKNALEAPGSWEFRLPAALLELLLLWP